MALRELWNVSGPLREYDDDDDDDDDDDHRQLGIGLHARVVYSNDREAGVLSC